MARSTVRHGRSRKRQMATCGSVRPTASCNSTASISCGGQLAIEEIAGFRSKSDLLAFRQLEAKLHPDNPVLEFF